MNLKIERTPQLEESILAAIRAGSFPEVAAAAFGVPKRLFRKWKQQGNVHDPESFAHKVAKARATARLDAEIRTHEKDPRLWLRAGPGRETKDAAGWTAFVRSQARAGAEINIFETPVILRLLTVLREALAPFPEALDAVTQALDKVKQPL
jgi:hypothetical protein